MMKRFLLALALLLGMTTVSAQITVPNTLVAGAVIAASGLNTNFTTIANHSLDRLAGGTISGNIAVDNGITIDGIDIGATVCSTCTPTFGSLTLTAGLTAGSGAVALISSAGQIPAISSTYFASLSGANLTALTAANLTGSLPAISGVNLTNLNASNLASGTAPIAQGGTGASTLGAALVVTQTSTLTGTQNDMNLVSQTIPTIQLRFTNSSLVTIDGFQAGFDGQELQVISAGTGQVDFAPQNSGSSAVNRLILFVTVGNTSLAPGSGTALFRYDGTTARWRLISHDQGAPITRAFLAANYTTATPANYTWTVPSAFTDTYWLHDRQLTIVEVVGGVVATISSVGPELRMTLPQSYVSAKRVGVVTNVIPNTVGQIGFATSNSTLTYLQFYVDATTTTNWTGGGVTASVFFNGTIEVQ